MNRGACQRFTQNMNLHLRVIVECHEKFTVFFENSHLQGFWHVHIVGVLHRKGQTVVSNAEEADSVVIP